MGIHRWSGVILFLLALPVMAGAQQPQARQSGPGVITGTVVGELDGQPVAGATVAIRRMADSTLVGGKITDRQGQFRVDALPEGSYMVQVSALGRAPQTQRNVEITAGGPSVALGTIRLANAAVMIEGVVGRAAAPPMRMASDRTIYTIRDMPVVSGGVATDVLRTVPEVEVDVDGKITAMGATPAVHLNGRPAPMQGEALTAFLLNLPADRIDRIEYIPNPSARYEAEGQGGILNIVLRDDTSLGLSGTLSANAGTRGQQGGSARLNFQEGRLTFFGGGSLNMSSSDNSNFDLRENLRSDPVTLIRLDGRSVNQRIFGSGDATVEWKLTPRATVWSGLRGSLSAFENNGTTRYLHMDVSEHPTDRYDRRIGTENSYSSGFASLGLRRVVQAARNEESAELRVTRNRQDNLSQDSKFLRALLSGELLSLPPELTHNDVDQGDTNVTFNVDVSRPWGQSGRIDVGYRGSFRGIDNEQLIERYTSDDAVVPLSTTQNAFEHREAFNSLYATVDRRFGKAGVQLGVRAERADTEFALPLSDERFENDYMSVFPSANLSYDLGGGRQMRLSYSRRLDRPQPFMLNPINNSTDPLNRFGGNPYLKPQYTHSFTFESAWNKPFGSVRMAPYFRRTVDVWDQLRDVDVNGVSTVSFHNLASSQTYGSNVSVSLRQLGPFSGLLSAQGFRTDRDAGDLPSQFSRSTLSWSANGNVTTRITPTLNLQTSGFYNPARDLPQGRISPFFYLTVSGRQQLRNNKVSLNASIVDPFNMYRFNLVTHDPSHRQTSRGTQTMRRASLSISYNFGRPPQSSRRNQGEGEVMQDPQGGAGGLR